jgi:hypothetical protein
LNVNRANYTNFLAVFVHFDSPAFLEEFKGHFAIVELNGLEAFFFGEEFHHFSSSLVENLDAGSVVITLGLSADLQLHIGEALVNKLLVIGLSLIKVLKLLGSTESVNSKVVLHHFFILSGVWDFLFLSDCIVSQLARFVNSFFQLF